MMDESIQRIGLADNRTAPYGMAADAFLEAKNLKTNRLDKLVVGESIGQVNQYIVTGAVDVAFTSYAFKIKHGDDYGYIEVDQSFFDPILQNAMVITNQEGVSSEAAKKMVDYIQSSKIKAVLNYFGYFTD
jgi:molybdate transport system substrate-binding protein